MADDSDRAQAQNEAAEAAALATYRKPEAPKRGGRCLNRASLRPDARFCDSDCRDDWEEEEVQDMNDEQLKDAERFAWLVETLMYIGANLGRASVELTLELTLEGANTLETPLYGPGSAGAEFRKILDKLRGAA